MDSSPISAAPKPASDTPHKITQRAVAGWVIYDLANTIFSMGVISLTFPLWIRTAVGAEKADERYGFISALSMGLIFFASPLLGAMTDRARRRMPFLIGSTLLCVFFTGLMARLGFYWTAAFFIIANIAYQAGTQFYDAMLPEVSTDENRGRIGGIGVGIGYLGSYIAVGIGTWVAHNRSGVEWLANATASHGKSLNFFLIAVLFLLFAIPCFVFVKERGNPNPRPINFEMVRNSTRQTIETLRSSRQYPGLLRFLIGRMFYTDPINTVINIMSLYTINVAMRSGLDHDAGDARAHHIMAFAITFAIVGGFFWGWITDKIGPRRTLNHVLRAWMLIFTGAACVGLFSLPMWTMYAVAAFSGFCLGGVWASDRPYMLRLTPPHRIGEFYGLYGMVGRFSAVTGPLIWAVVTGLMIRIFKASAPTLGGTNEYALTLRAQGIAILVLLFLMFLSYWILQPVSDHKREWAPAKE